MSKSAIVRGWRQTTLGKHVRIHSGSSPSQAQLDCNGAYPFVKVEDLNNCEKYQSSSRFYTNNRRFCAPAGSIMFPKRGAAIMNNKVRIARTDFAMDTNIMAIEPAQDIDNEFLFYVIKSEGLYKIADTSTVPQINNKHINPYILTLPPLPEQRKIAEILRTWDEAIEKLEALRAAKQRRQSRLADDLLFGRRRLGCRSPWRSRRLADVTEELTDRNTSLSLDRSTVMGVTNARGIVPMRDQTIGADLARYKILPPKAFAYNPMRINVGSIAMSPFDGDVLVSPDYVLFRCIEGRLDPDFLDHLRGTHWWSHHINAGGSGSVRMRTYYDDLAALRLDLPKYDEQLAIARVLNTGRQEIALVEAEIEAITRQKRGLMQKLLTGEWRVQC